MELAAANLAYSVLLSFVIKDIEALGLLLGVPRAKTKSTVTTGTPRVHLLVHRQHQSVRCTTRDRCQWPREPRELDGCGLQDDLDVVVRSSTSSLL